jgi:hypothetical protein
MFLSIEVGRVVVDVFSVVKTRVSIDHLLVHCPMGRYASGVVQCAFGIKIDFKSVSDIIGWVFMFPRSVRCLVATGVTAVMWAL